MPIIITITTDFGELYPSIMKGVMLKIDPVLKLIDITNAIAPGDIVQGAFALRYASTYFPEGTIHLAVVDPGVGSDRRAIVIKGEHYTFVGPDNGLLLPAARAQGKFEVYEITDHMFYTKNVSPVFHGRDVFAPAAAYMSLGKEIPGLKRINDPVDLDFGVPHIMDKCIQGKALFVDTFGNVVTNIGGDALKGLFNYGQTLDVNGVAATLVRTYSDAEKGSLLVLVGSHGMIEISCRGDNAADIAGLKSEHSIMIKPQ